jgi:cardiolipin synthase
MPVWVPNAITATRLASVPLIVWLILAGHLTTAFWLFVAAGISDGIDGALARSFRARTRLGGYIDPAADKALLVAVYISLSVADLVPDWLVWLVVGRDIIIVAGVSALYLMKERLAMQPLAISKLNTFAQLGLAALVLAVYGPGLGRPDWLQTAILFTTATTVLSLLQYIGRGIGILRHRNPSLVEREP